MNPISFISCQLKEKYLSNLKLEVHRNINEICAFTGEKITEGIKKKDFISTTFTDFEYIKFNNEIPLKIHEDGYFLASYMQFEQEVNFKGSWKKRWANKHDKLADFGKSKRVVEIDKGKFKSYDMPLNLHAIDKVWFYFDSDNISEVERLLSKHLYGLGKKTSQGYGKIKDMLLKQIDFNPFENIIRPVPMPKDINENEKTNLLMSGRVQLCRYFPPYWSNVDSEVCLVR